MKNNLNTYLWWFAFVMVLVAMAMMVGILVFLLDHYVASSLTLNPFWRPFISGFLVGLFAFVYAIFNKV